jgi:phenylalanyl-tRNA synthetase alpha chain
MIDKILQAGLNALNNANKLEELELVKVNYLGKSGELTLLMSKLKDLPNDEKPLFGKQINEAKVVFETNYQTRKQDLELVLLNERLANETLDITLPGVALPLGSTHLLNQVISDVEDFFISRGFKVLEGPEVESDYYNFEMMNLPKGHPARAMQDSFYIDEKTLLRTHTSPVQARAMLAAAGKPLAIICPGKVYRRDDDDLTHSHQFMQIEGLVIDAKVSFANLKATLLELAKHLFGETSEIRLRPSFFPFTEPSCEVDVSYIKPNGEQGYLEILGAGMVHPKVLTMGGYNADKVNGFAFGVGVERIAMLKYKIDDIRNFYTNDVRFLNQFKGVK